MAKKWTVRSDIRAQVWRMLEHMQSVNRYLSSALHQPDCKRGMVMRGGGGGGGGGRGDTGRL